VTLWRLEWLRLSRTGRWAIIAAVYAAFGAIGPLTVRYLPDILERFGESTVGLPEFTPADGITQYVANAQQLGLLAVAFVAAAALAIDTNTELSVFFRTRASIRDIVTPRIVVNVGAAVAGFSLGAVIAYVGTGIMLEWLDIGPFLLGVALQGWYLVFAVTIVALMASLVRKTVATAFLSVAALIAFGVLALVPQLAPWLPSYLVGALDQLIRGGGFEYTRALAVTTLLIVVLPMLAIQRFSRREV
jgi:ABC-2 type transport system permease protein